MVRVVPLETEDQAYQNEMRASAMKKRVSISCGSIKMTDDDDISIGGLSNRRWRPADTIVSVVMPDMTTDDDEKKKKSFTPSIVEYVKVVSIIYLLVMTIIGLIFPISEALTDNWLKTTYNAIFMSYQLIVGTAFLIYLQVITVLQKRKKNKGHNIGDAAEVASAMGVRTGSFDDLNGLPRVQRRASIHPDFIDQRRPSMYADFDKRRPSMYADFDKRRPSMFADIDRRRQSMFPDFDKRRASIYPADFDAQTTYEDDGSALVWMDVSKFGSIFNHEGSSLFLKFGALLFSLGNLIYYALEIENSMKENQGCQLTYMLGWTFVLRLIFVLVQTYFIFKGPEVSQTKHLPFLWFGMLHLVSTNICLWFRIVVREIMEEAQTLSEEELNDNSSLTNFNFSDSNYDCEIPLLHTASRYLFPFVLEYSLIAVGTIACIIHSISQPTDSEGNLVKGLQNLIKVCSITQAAKSNDEKNPGPDGDDHDDEHAILSKSHGGLFIGSLLFAGVIVTIVMFYFYDDGITSSATLYLVADIVLHSSLLTGCCLALVLIRPLAYVAKPMSTDDAFLVVAMCGSAMYEIAIIVASGATIEEQQESLPEEPLRLTSSLLSVIQTLVQAMLILCAVRRYPSSEEHVRTMPGRGTFTFLIVGNISVWVLRTALAKSIDMTTMSEFYGDVSWLLLGDVNLPLLLFFRFHCSVCFADVWHATYTPLQSKLKKINKRQPPPPPPPAFSPTFDESPLPDSGTLPLPQICISPSSENQENVDTISLASCSSTSI